MFRVLATATETPDGVQHLKLSVEMNGDIFEDLDDESSRALLKTAADAILQLTDKTEIDRSELE